MIVDVLSLPLLFIKEESYRTICVTAVIEMFQAGSWGFLESGTCSWLWTS